MVKGYVVYDPAILDSLVVAYTVAGIESAGCILAWLKSSQYLRIIYLYG